MKRGWLVLLVVSLALVPCARAQEDGGLYAPFPEAGVPGRAGQYLDQLDVKVTAAELREGRFVGRPRALADAPGTRAASTRAGTVDAPSGWLFAPIAGALIVAVLAGWRRRA